MRTTVQRAFSVVAIAGLAAACAPEPPPEPTPSVAERVVLASPYAITADAEAAQFVQTRAEQAIADHCAACHGADLRGKPGVPNLVDYDWLWGVTLEETNDVAPVMEIEQTIRHGIRNDDCPLIADQARYGGCPDTRYSEMPGYGTLGTFTAEQIGDLTEYTLSLAGESTDAEAAARGQALGAVCIECHGPGGTGYKPYGGPDLTDDVSLYGGDRATIADVLTVGRLGSCPAWAATLDAATIKSLAVYIWKKVQEG